jgi:osmotically-inducible protein OsmY
MFGRNEVSDKELLKTVNRRLDRAGSGSQSKITASVRRGTVTLSGKLRYDNQRSPIVKAVQAVAGVRHVIDQLQTAPKTKPQSTFTVHGMRGLGG